MNKIIKYGWWALIIIPFLFAFGVYVNYGYKTNKPICPDDFKDSDQKIASFSEWTEEFTQKYPNATNLEFSQARREFYVENNCTEELKRYDDYIAGNMDEEKN